MRYSGVKDDTAHAHGHDVYEDCLGIDRAYLTFPNVSSCLICVSAFLDRGTPSITGVHLTRSSETAVLNALAAEADVLRGGSPLMQCYVIGAVEHWAGQPGRTWPLETQERTVVRRMTDALGWPPNQPVPLLDQGGWVSQQFPAVYVFAYQAVLNAGVLELSVRPDRLANQPFLQVPPNAFLQVERRRAG